MAEVEFEFQELTPRDTLGRPITGIMLYGTASLESADPNDPHSFYVASITLEGAASMRRSAELNKPSSFDGMLFAKIADELENSKTELGRLAQAEFSEKVESEEPEIPFRQRMARELERRA